MSSVFGFIYTESIHKKVQFFDTKQFSGIYQQNWWEFLSLCPHWSRRNKARSSGHPRSVWTACTDRTGVWRAANGKGERLTLTRAGELPSRAWRTEPEKVCFGADTLGVHVLWHSVSMAFGGPRGTKTNIPELRFPRPSCASPCCAKAGICSGGPSRECSELGPGQAP